MPANDKAHTYALPNLLTYGRIAAVPLMVLCFFIEGRLAASDLARWSALAIFVIASLTDYLDGYLARKWQQASAIGKMLDPIADKLLVSVALLLLAAEGTIAGWSLWAAIVILCREILVSGLREYLAAVRVSVPVSQLAKWKTTIQLVAVGFLLAGPAGDKVVPYVSETGIVLLWISAIITLYTGWDYYRSGLQHVTDSQSS
ncbi:MULTISPECIES: CDP-diacylglycerol--glycerol-3-phosphate 3-phosphatidyltransferase [unclassified Roseitalea]|uniref:CDP-diacylglycerol--glycerol-3-phosphate 3-phosphatidyltransferase n=1 Tax=unclassified Roseitalea TaxID=2639107 RepID=UPI00273E4FAD|nr:MULTISPECIES: CDP-diacylglycerol--glycerol-3-phosphate 3-phosphatidyltransferase [unclassified Roseitalea]